MIHKLNSDAGKLGLFLKKKAQHLKHTLSNQCPTVQCSSTENKLALMIYMLWQKQNGKEKRIHTNSQTHIEWKRMKTIVIKTSKEKPIKNG